MRNFRVIFVDLDECQSPDACGANRVCNNTVGSYRCECPVGFAAGSGEQDPQNRLCVGRNLTYVEEVDLSHTEKQVDFLREKPEELRLYSHYTGWPLRLHENHTRWSLISARFL